MTSAFYSVFVFFVLHSCVYSSILCHSVFRRCDPGEHIATLGNRSELKTDREMENRSERGKTEVNVLHGRGSLGNSDCPVFLIQPTWIQTLLPPLSYFIMPALKMDQGEVESGVGAAGICSALRGLTLSLIFMPLCLKDKREMEWETRSEQGCVTVVMHEWLFLLSVPPPPLKDAVEDVEWAERSRKPRREAAGRRVGLVREKTVSHDDYYSITFDYIGIKTN